MMTTYTVSFRTLQAHRAQNTTYWVHDAAGNYVKGAVYQTPAEAWAHADRLNAEFDPAHAAREARADEIIAKMRTMLTAR